MSKLSIEGLKAGITSIKVKNGDAISEVEFEVIDQTLSIPEIELEVGTPKSILIEMDNYENGGASVYSLLDKDLNASKSPIRIVNSTEQSVTLFTESLFEGFVQLSMVWVYKGIKYTALSPITVKPKEIVPSPISATLIPSHLFGTVGEELPIDISITPAGSQFKKMEWIVSPEGSIEVSKVGTLKLNTVGESTVKCLITDNEDRPLETNTMEVTVVSEAILPDSLEIISGLEEVKNISGGQRVLPLNILGKEGIIRVKLSKDGISRTELNSSITLKRDNLDISITSIKKVPGKVNEYDVGITSYHIGKTTNVELISAGREGIAKEKFQVISNDRSLILLSEKQSYETNKDILFSFVPDTITTDPALLPKKITFETFPESDFKIVKTGVSSVTARHNSSFPKDILKYIKYTIQWEYGDSTVGYKPIYFENVNSSGFPFNHVNPSIAQIPFVGEASTTVDLRYNYGFDGAVIKVSKLIDDITTPVVWNETFKATGGMTVKPVTVTGGGIGDANYFIIRVESGALFYEYYLPTILYR